MIRCIPQDAELLEALGSAARFQEQYGADISEHLDVAREIVEQTLEFGQRVATTRPWGGYLAVSVESNKVIGCGGFKGGPQPGGCVEIAYFTFPGYEGQGFGTATARELVRIAESASEIEAVVAHTLPEHNASTRILEKVGFVHVAEVTDPDDGLVWQWRRSRSAEAGRAT
jgi:[ribosomal protein S5]-alanine N-acetyltransferase